MAELTFKSPGVSTREIDLSGPTKLTPSGIPAGIIGTAVRGPAFVPITVASFTDFVSKFGATDGEKFGPIAFSEWMASARSGTYLRLLGVGDGKTRQADGTVKNAGFVVGNNLPQASGLNGINPFSIADDGESHTAATGVGILSIKALTGVTATFTITVPDAAGGSGSAVTYTFVHNNNNGAGPNAGAIHIGYQDFAGDNPISDANSNTLRALLVAAINAGTATDGRVTNGGGGAANGSVGITASNHADPGKITLTADRAGKVGNDVALATTVGVNIVQAANLSGGAQANDGSGNSGRTYFLGCFMSASVGSSIFSDAGIATPREVSPHKRHGGAPILRGVLFAPGGVLLSLSSSATTNNDVSSVYGMSGTYGSSAHEGDAGHPLGNINTNGQADQEFVMLLNGHKNSATSTNTITASFDPESPSYFVDVLNKDPIKTEEMGHCLYAHWDIRRSFATPLSSSLVTKSSGESDRWTTGYLAAFMLTSSLDRNSGTASSTTKVGVPNFENFEDRFSAAFSPFVISQEFGGRNKDLFRIHALDDGAVGAGAYKITIENVFLDSNVSVKYGSFDIVIRRFNDTDKEVVELQSFRGLNLNPASENYIAKKIGDQHTYYDFDKKTGNQKLVVEGSYPNVSSYIRVEMSENVKNGAIDDSALPLGFRGLHHLVTSGSTAASPSAGSILTPGDLSPLGVSTGLTQTVFSHIVQPPVPMRENISVGKSPLKTLDSDLTWGVQFEYKPNPTEPNSGRLIDASILSFTKHFPSHAKTSQSAWIGDNAGTPDIAQAIMDSDRFNNNKFSLEKIQVITGSGDKIDKNQWAAAEYQRTGVPLAAITDIDGTSTDKTRLIKPSDFSVSDNSNYLKFTFPLMGGFDGVNIFDKEKINMSDLAVRREMSDSNQGLTAGATVASVRKAVDIMEEKADVDIQLLAIPGMRHEAVTDYALESVERRFDALYLMDVEHYDSDNTIITGSGQTVSVGNTASKFISRNLDSSFGAAYAPNVIIVDPTTSTNVSCPPTVAVMGAMAQNDRLAHPWFAPAGYRRGVLGTTVEVDTKLNRTNLDDLYSARINPITTFPEAQGAVIFGQKTLQAAQTALDRINVRRLLIDVRRKVKDVANTLLFEPNREETLARFRSAVLPILQRIQSLQGLSNFRVDIDTTTTTQADVENNTIRGKIFLQPTRSVEFISLDFVVTNAGAEL